MDPFGPKRVRACSCCDATIVDGQRNLSYRRVHFRLNSEAAGVTFSSFCPECAHHEWTIERLVQLNAQMQDAWHRSVCAGGLLSALDPQHPCVYDQTPYPTLAVVGLAGEYPPQTWNCAASFDRCPHPAGQCG